ncbi:MAG: SAF domain-containing protein, partial [Burkholderiales bacterium]
AVDAIGEPFHGPSEAEKPQLTLRRSLYFIKDLPAGAVVEPDAIDTARPALGIEPRYFEVVVGSTLAVEVKFGTPVQWHHLQQTNHGKAAHRDVKESRS